MKTIELYLHGLKWKNEEISEGAFKAGRINLYVEMENKDVIRFEEAVFLIRECSELRRASTRNYSSHQLSLFRESDIPIDEIKHYDSRNGTVETLYIWYRANCDNSSFYINEQGDLSFRETDRIKRYFPDVRDEPKIKSKPVPQNKSTIFDIIDLE